ncbi:hypothetical protein L1987_66663 [Smallanthus sonchifolius]|uniref:Uncharacterized protein n=1 Tax=Smallanthus sonchifolius TaxID=185202 RepID=A0ACB9BXR1_9ASTR|nr:hypothetical protein L1987_66663 [Smallanthus sonchifolius]
MDVDPCVVATRKEIVAKSFDLTASEHSGVNFSQATTSSYPTSLADVPPMKDVVVTKTESKNNAKDSSTINQETSSPVAKDTLDQESEKKNQDLEITQKLLVSTVIKQETPSSVANDSLDQEPEIKNQNLLQTEAADESLFVCNIPEPGQDYQKIATVEVVNRNDIGIYASCELCGVCCTSRDMLNEHISGKKHQKNLKKSENQRAPVANTASPEPMNEEGEIVFSEMSKRKANVSLTSEDTKRQKANEEEEGRGVLVTCKLCNVDCNSLMEFKTHLAGFEHSVKALKQGKGGSYGLQV